MASNEILTVTRIGRVIEALQRSIQYQNGGDMAYVIADAIKGLEELLVEKEADSKPVPDEELDQMIWKLERDGMTPKLLSLMRELREVRRVKGEPVGEFYEDGSLNWYQISDGDRVPNHRRIPLYRHAAMLPTDGTLTNEGTMQLSGNSEQLEPVSKRDELPAKFKPVADLYGITSPTGSETTFTFDAVEASDSAKGGWLVQEYVELERYQAAVAANFRETVNSSTNNFRENAETSTNSFTDAELEMMAHGNNPQANAYRELLARRNSPVTPDVWIPVSERMPDDTVDADGGATCYLVFYAEGRQPNGGSNVQVSNVTYLRRWHEGMITHWMPLPEPPMK